MSENKTVCPHCRQKMNKMKPPSLSTWSSEFFYVCFNDDCPYFVRSWEHTANTTQAHCSYRHRYDPDSGQSGPLPVWSKDAMKSDILA
jgi:hypothetical protein